MSNEERTINMFLADGVRTVQETSATRAVAFSWDQLEQVQELGGDLSDFSTSKRPSVYILIGPERFQAYVGQAAGIYQRLQNHKFLWTDAVVLVSRDLTQGCAEYAEAKLIEAISENSCWSLENKQRPTHDETKLSRSEKSVAKKFVDQAKVLVAALIWDMFRGVITSSAGGPLFLLKGREYDAKMVEASSFQVKKGSKAKGSEAKKIPSKAKRKRQELLAEGILKQRKNESLVFTKDYNFSSLSAATQVVTGSTSSGKTAWKLANDQNYVEWESSNDEQQEDEIETSPPFLLKGREYDAEMVVSPAFRVKEGSEAKGSEAKTIPSKAKRKREELLAKGTLKRSKDGLVFKRDHNFSSLSAATQVVTGSTSSGKTAWKLANDQTYADWKSSKQNSDS